MAQKILYRSIQSLLDECTQILEDIRVLNAEDELIAQLRQSNPPYTYNFMVPQIKGARRLAQATIGAEEVLLKDMNEGVQGEYRRTLIFGQKNYARLEEAYNESRALLRSLEALRSKALDEEDED